jgi:hypothetical protein
MESTMRPITMVSNDSISEYMQRRPEAADGMIDRIGVTAARYNAVRWGGSAAAC